MQQIEIEITGQDKMLKSLDNIISKIDNIALKAVEKASVNTSEDIKVVFKGGSSPGFKDRSGALRASIRGGISEELTNGDSIVGFVGAGDNQIGSAGKSTKDYVEFIEFGEFSRAGNTSFLRAGVKMAERSIKSIISEEINLEKLI